MRKPALLGAVLLAVLAAGCAGIEQLARSAFQEPRLTYRSAKLDALDLEGATIAFLFELTNPNAVGAELAKVAWSIDADGTRVASGDLPGGLSIPANGTAPVSFPVRVRFRDVPGILSLLGSGKDELPYKLAGTVGVKTPVGVVEVPMSHSDRLRLPRLPAFAVDGLSVRSASFSSVALDVRLRVRNPNAFPTPAGALDAALALGGTRVAHAQGARIDAVPGGGSALVVIPVQVDLATAGRAASELLQGGPVDLAVSGKADIAGIPMPVDLHARVPARR